MEYNKKLNITNMVLLNGGYTFSIGVSWCCLLVDRLFSTGSPGAAQGRIYRFSTGVPMVLLMGG